MKTTASSRGALWAADAVRPQPALMVGARKGARDLWVGRLAQQPGARLAAVTLYQRASGRLSPPELPRCAVQGAYRMSVSLRLW